MDEQGPMSEQQGTGQQPGGVSRRRLFGWVGAGTAGALAAGATGGVIGHSRAMDPAVSSGPAPTDAVAFAGAHQAGIVTPAQDRLHFIALDVLTDDRDELVEMLKTWTAAARRMTAGRDAGPVGAVDGEQHAAPDDTGEAIDLPAVRPRWRSCRPSRATSWTRPSAAGTCASRPAPTTPRSRCTQFATSCAWARAW
jgi:deferrochelatase/peroxidase EfeB